MAMTAALRPPETRSTHSLVSPVLRSADRTAREATEHTRAMLEVDMAISSSRRKSGTYSRHVSGSAFLSFLGPNTVPIVRELGERLTDEIGIDLTGALAPSWRDFIGAIDTGTAQVVMAVWAGDDRASRQRTLRRRDRRRAGLPGRVESGVPIGGRRPSGDPRGCLFGDRPEERVEPPGLGQMSPQSVVARPGAGPA